MKDISNQFIRRLRSSLCAGAVPRLAISRGRDSRLENAPQTRKMALPERWYQTLRQTDISKLGGACPVLIIGPTPLIANCFHRAFERLAGVNQRFFFLSVSKVFKRAQKLFLRTGEMFSM